MTFHRGPVPAAALGVVAATMGLLAGCGDNSNNIACTSGNVCTWAGTGEPEFNGDGHARQQSSLFMPMDLDFAPDGRAYVLDWQNHRVRRVNADDTFETVIGTGDVGDGPLLDPAPERTPPGVPGTTVILNHPTDVVFAADGTMILSAWHNHKIRRFDPATGLVDVACGNGPGFAGDTGPAAAALMNQPKAAVIDGAGNIFVLDTRNFRVRKIAADAQGTITTVAGSAMRGFAGDGGPALMAQLALQKVSDNPEPGGGLAIDGVGRLYIVDTENQRIRRVDLDLDVIETIAGNGTAGFSGDGGPATQAALNYPRDAEFGPDGRLYIADTENHRVRVVDPSTGVITTFAGDGEPRFSGDGAPALKASFWRPWGIAFDAAGNLYVADTINNRIRKVTR